jgi:hypothetical protein
VGKGAKIWGVAWLTAASLLAAPLLDEPVATLALKDGTALQEAQAKGFLSKVVLVKHQGGVRTVPYELFPDDFQAALAAKRQAVLAAAEAERTRREAGALNLTQPKAAPPAPSAVSEPELHEGCRMTFTSSKGNVAILKIENVSDHVVSLLPSQFGARSTAGEEFSGAEWVGIYYKKDRMAAAWKGQRSVDPGATVTLALMLTAPPSIKDGSIETVFWK